MQFVKFELRLGVSKNISRQFMTTHKNSVLVWRVECLPKTSDPYSMNFCLTYIDGPSERVQFECSINNGGTERFFKASNKNVRDLSLVRGEKYTRENIPFDGVWCSTYGRELRMKVTTSSFDLDIASERQDLAIGFGIDYHKNIENPDSKYSDMRLISGDNRTFYCHRIILAAQSKDMDATFQNPKTEEEKNGTFRLSAWSTEELRKMLAYCYGNKSDLESSSIQQLINIYKLAERQGLDRLTDFIRSQLWKRGIENENSSKPSDVRLISSDNRTFYCHRVVLRSQSAVFRNGRTEEEKKGTFHFTTWTTEELRKILEYYYTRKVDLKSSTVKQLIN